MATPQGFSAQGTIVSRSLDPLWPPTLPVGGPVNFTDIAELTDVTPPPQTRKELETTTHNSADAAYVVGIRRKGAMTLQLNFVPKNGTHDQLTGLQYSWDQGLRDIYRITYP